MSGQARRATANTTVFPVPSKADDIGRSETLLPHPNGETLGEKSIRSGLTTLQLARQLSLKWHTANITMSIKR
jgi:hypothetical protein